MSYKFTKYFSFFLLLILLFSCSSHKKTIYKTHMPPPQSKSHHLDPKVHYPQSKEAIQRKKIVHYAIKNLGLPYKWGGISPETGFDCSGLIFYTLQKADIILPRTAKAQFYKGKQVSPADLQMADLVFFTPPQKTTIFHVGIYIGDGMFIHAPGKGRKVTYGYLTNPYFKKYFIGARSYL